MQQLQWELEHQQRLVSELMAVRGGGGSRRVTRPSDGTAISAAQVRGVHRHGEGIALPDLRGHISVSPSLFGLFLQRVILSNHSLPVAHCTQRTA